MGGVRRGGKEEMGREETKVEILSTRGKNVIVYFLGGKEHTVKDSGFGRVGEFFWGYKQFFRGRGKRGKTWKGVIASGIRGRARTNAFRFRGKSKGC